MQLQYKIWTNDSHLEPRLLLQKQSDRETGFWCFRSCLSNALTCRSWTALVADQRLRARDDWPKKSCLILLHQAGVFDHWDHRLYQGQYDLQCHQANNPWNRILQIMESVSCWFQIGFVNFKLVSSIWLASELSCQFLFRKSTLIITFVYLCHLPFWRNTSSSLMEQTWACPGLQDHFSNFVRTPFSVSD